MRPLILFVLAGTTSLAFSQSVAERWSKSEALGGSALPRYTATFDNGNFAVLSMVNRSGRMDGVLSSYGPDGATKWVKTLWNADRFVPRALKEAGSGDLYVLGTVGPVGSTDTYVARVAPSGVTVWSKRFNLSAETRDDTAVTASFDGSDNFYFGGELYLQPSTISNVRSAFVSKVSAGGTLAFTRSFTINSTESARTTGIAVNSAGEIAACVANTQDRVWKLDATGATQWVRIPGVINECSTILMDNTGHIYIGGSRFNSATDGAPAIQKLNPDGTVSWTRWTNFNAGDDAFDTINAMRFDSNNNIWATGSAFYNGWDFLLLKVSPNGDVLATRLNNSYGTNDDSASSIHLGINNDLYLAGSMTGPSMGGYFATKADLNGNFAWDRFSPAVPSPILVFQGSCFNEKTGQILLLLHNDVAGTAVLRCLTQPGVSTPDAYTVAMNGTLNGSTVLANDIYAGDGIALLVGNATNGNVSLNSDGTFTYQPNTGFTGTDTFTYRIVKPGVTTSFLTTVTITVQ